MTGPENGNNSLQQINPINFAQLRQDTYFESLIQAAYSTGNLSDGELKGIQQGCIYLLAEKTKKYTGGSSSFLIEDGENIMKSNLYTIGLYLKSLISPHKAIEAVKTTPIPELYALGQKRIKTKLNATRYLYNSTIKNTVFTGYDYYNFTLQTVQRFFDLYTDFYTWYNAHELPAEIIFPYPICYTGYIGEEELFAISGVDDFKGIEYVQRYLQAVYYESAFCKYFTKEDIHQVLLGYGSGYNDVLFNIYEKVLVAAIKIITPEADFSKPRGEVELILANAYNVLVEKMKLSAQVREYVRVSLMTIIHPRLNLFRNYRNAHENTERFNGFSYANSDFGRGLL